ncbi:MAG: hypothetical protein HFJ37_03625 [Clostridia bacterium]|nr:hypothetical protein [Clostridia bacterium]
MQMIKYGILFLILVGSSLIGRFLSKKYVYRLEELEEMQNALNIFKSKIKFTYEPIPEIFDEISRNTNQNIGSIFQTAKEKMNHTTANIAWEQAIQETDTNLKEEDKQTLKTLSKLLGQTDVDGQTSQIEITEKLLEGQIKQAAQEKQKNERLYTRLGTILGLAIVIVLC